jgi:hypothetical protein
MPARSLADIKLTQDDFKADFEITDKYQAFSSELLRLSLLGIAGYGFLLSNIALKDAAPSEFFRELSNHAWLLGAGVSCLGLAAGAALAHRFYSTACLLYQVSILRLLKRPENQGWSEEELRDNQERLAEERRSQERVLNRARALLIASAVLLSLGIIAVALTFAVILFKRT